MSHHLYTNTINDVEISFLEPFLFYLPGEKNVLLKYLQWVITPIFYSLIFFGEFVKE